MIVSFLDSCILYIYNNSTILVLKHSEYFYKYLQIDLIDLIEIFADDLDVFLRHLLKTCSNNKISIGVLFYPVLFLSPPNFITKLLNIQKNSNEINIPILTTLIKQLLTFFHLCFCDALHLSTSSWIS